MNTTGHRGRLLPEKSGFIFALGFVFAIYIAFILVYLMLAGGSSFLYFQYSYIVVGVLTVATIGFLFYAARRKQVAAFYMIFTIIGVIILVFSTIVTAPHVTSESYSYGGQPLIDPINFTQTFPGSYNVTDPFRAVPARLYMNFSILRIRVFSNGSGVLKLLESRSSGMGGTQTVVLSMRVWNVSQMSPVTWLDYFWTPTGPYDENVDYSHDSETYYYDGGPSLALAFENQESSPVTIQCHLDAYAAQLNGDIEVSTPLPVINSGFAYLGISFIAAAVLIEFGAWIRKTLPAWLIARSSKQAPVVGEEQGYI